MKSLIESHSIGSGSEAQNESAENIETRAQKYSPRAVGWKQERQKYNTVGKITSYFNRFIPKRKFQLFNELLFNIDSKSSN